MFSVCIVAISATDVIVESGMSNEQRQLDLESLQGVIYRDKVLRARKMTRAERITESFELSDEVLERMLAGAMWQKNLEDVELGWLEVQRRLDRLDHIHEHELYTTEQRKVV